MTKIKERNNNNLKEEIPNEEALSSIKEVVEMEKNPDNYNWFTDLDSLIEDLNN